MQTCDDNQPDDKIKTENHKYKSPIVTFKLKLTRKKL